MRYILLAVFFLVSPVFASADTLVSQTQFTANYTTAKIGKKSFKISPVAPVIIETVLVALIKSIFYVVIFRKTYNKTKIKSNERV